MAHRIICSSSVVPRSWCKCRDHAWPHLLLQGLLQLVNPDPQVDVQLHGPILDKDISASTGTCLLCQSKVSRMQSRCACLPKRASQTLSRVSSLRNPRGGMWQRRRSAGQAAPVSCQPELSAGVCRGGGQDLQHCLSWRHLGRWRLHQHIPHKAARSVCSVAQLCRYPAVLDGQALCSQISISDGDSTQCASQPSGYPTLNAARSLSTSTVLKAAFCRSWIFVSSSTHSSKAASALSTRHVMESSSHLPACLLETSQVKCFCNAWSPGCNAIPWSAQSAREDGESLVKGCLDGAAGLTQGDRLEEDAVVGGDLAHLPQLGGCDGAGAHKAAQAGAVKHQRYRHVPCTRTRASDVSPVPGCVQSQLRRCHVTDLTALQAGETEPECRQHVPCMLTCCLCRPFYTLEQSWWSQSLCTTITCTKELAMNRMLKHAYGPDCDQLAALDLQTAPVKLMVPMA